VFCDENQHKINSGEERRKEELEAFVKLYKEKLQPESHKPKLGIPKFYQSLPQEEDVLKVKLREEARTLLLQKKSAEVLSSEGEFHDQADNVIKMILLIYSR
jgi:hypothetical protein